MQPETASPSDPLAQIIRLARLAAVCTLAMAAVLLLADFVGRGWSTAELRFLSEKVVVTFICALAIEIVGAIAAVVLLALRK